MTAKYAECCHSPDAASVPMWCVDFGSFFDRGTGATWCLELFCAYPSSLLGKVETNWKDNRRRLKREKGGRGVCELCQFTLVQTHKYT